MLSCWWGAPTAPVPPRSIISKGEQCVSIHYSDRLDRIFPAQGCSCSLHALHPSILRRFSFHVA